MTNFLTNNLPKDIGTMIWVHNFICFNGHDLADCSRSDEPMYFHVYLCMAESSVLPQSIAVPQHESCGKFHTGFFMCLIYTQELRNASCNWFLAHNMFVCRKSSLTLLRMHVIHRSDLASKTQRTVVTADHHPAKSTTTSVE